MEREVKFDIALSFAGEDRAYVQQVAEILNTKGVKVFYDKFEEANLWGKNLYDYLSDIYQNKAFFTIVFISENYNKKMWTNHERQAMQSRAFQENYEYILPARFDDTEIPGLFPTISYISLTDKDPKEFCEIILKKLVLSGRTIPSELIRRSLSPLVKIPKAVPSKFTVTVKNETSAPFVGVDVLLLADNNTYLRGRTDDNGKAEFTINIRREYKMYLANENTAAYIVERIDPDNDVEITLRRSENIGSIICNSTGYIPSLKGRLNPILDTSRRTYLYADNIAVNGGMLQPVTFKIDTPLELEDCDGVVMKVTIKDIQGRSSLIEYIKPVFED